jgi:hypothetical protein
MLPRRSDQSKLAHSGNAAARVFSADPAGVGPGASVRVSEQ